METNKAAKLADLVVSYHQWHIREVTAEILSCHGAPDIAVIAHVMKIAVDPDSRFPSRIGATWNPGEYTAKRPGRREPCDICGRPEWQCGQVKRNGCGDGHNYTPANPAGYRDADPDLMDAIEPIGRLI